MDLLNVPQLASHTMEQGRWGSCFWPPLSHLGTFSREKSEQCQAIVCPGSPAPRSSGGSQLTPARGPPTLNSLAWGLAHLWVLETKVWLCQVLQTLPKTTRGNTQMDEGMFPERVKFLLSTVLTLAMTQSIFRQMELASLPWP